MKKTLGLLGIAVFSAVSGFAGEFGELKAKIDAARESIVTMVQNADQRGEEQQKLVKDTAEAVSAMLAQMKAPAGKEDPFKELSETWAAFKKTREEELVPALLAGREEEAKKIASEIQKARYEKVIALCDQLD